MKDAFLSFRPSNDNKKRHFRRQELEGVMARGVGYDHIDVKAPTEKREYVTNTLGANAVSVAEFCIQPCHIFKTCNINRARAPILM